MKRIPLPALALGLAGLLPFFWGAATVLLPGLAEAAMQLVGPRFIGPYVLIAYGLVILCFLSGALWGFASRGDGWTGYALSVLPALWAFFTVGGGPERALPALIAGFLALLLLDGKFARAGLAPEWWMSLRIPLTAGVVFSLIVGQYG